MFEPRFVSWGEAKKYGFQFFNDLFMKIVRNAFMNRFVGFLLYEKFAKLFYNFLMCSTNLKIFIQTHKKSCKKSKIFMDFSLNSISCHNFMVFTTFYN